MAERPVVEVCIESAAGALAAEEGGADRIELCANLAQGGTTPSAGSIELAREKAAIDLVVLVRPRAGDFLYSAEEFEVMRRDVRRARELEADAVAIGVLAADGRVDEERTAELIGLARPLEVTFHRAFDHTRDPEEALEMLIELGIERVLTSGQAPSVPEGLGRIRELVEHAGDRIRVMPGGGVREHNVREIVERTGARDVHFSAGKIQESPMTHRNESCALGSSVLPGEYEIVRTDPERVRRFLATLGG